MKRSPVSLMSLEQICIMQEEQIERQSVIIRDLLTQLLQFRELTEEELRMMEDDIK